MKTNDVIGNSFHELSDEEMREIVGGNTITPDSTPVAGATVSFVVSWLGSAVAKCGNPHND